MKEWLSFADYKIAKQVWSESEFLWCHDFSLWCLLPMLRSIYFNTLIDTTFLHVYRYRRYYRSCLFEPTLQSVFSTWTDITIGVLDLNRCYDRCYQLMALLLTLKLVFSVCGPLYLLILIVCSNSRMLVVFIHKTVFF